MKKLFIVFLLIRSFALFADDCYQLEPLKNTNHFILVVDRSGSMSGEAIDQARKALDGFIDDMRSDDQASIVAFDDRIEVWNSSTSNKNSLHRSIRKLSARGGTRLYDAIGKAGMIAHQNNEQSIIIFFTDGHDGGSHLNISDLSGINLSQGVYVYGIGLGDVNQDALEQIAKKTGGKSIYTANSNKLSNIYHEVISNYYQLYGNRINKKSRIVVRSIPSKKPVIINGDRLLGTTPLLIDNLLPGTYDISVGFKRGDWKCQVDLPVGNTGRINARQDDLGRDIVIVSDVKYAMVFIDENFVGYTSVNPVVEKTVRKGFFKKVKVSNYSKQLVVQNVPKGKHTVRVVGLPDVENFFKPIETSFTINKKNIAISASCFNGLIETKETKQELRNYKKDDSYDEMDDMFKELGE
jgi:uncharacterized protein YegL